MKRNHTIFSSRYGSQRIVEQINDTQYILEGPSHFVRCGGTEDGKTDEIGMVDFEGGPYITLGTEMKHLDISSDSRKITKIEFIKHDQEKYAKVLLTVA